jgi:HD-GYP domain-containing protein (c-di-GMP phosphodiesterase class II)
MTQADLEFERFQTICVFAIAEEMNHIKKRGKEQRTAQIASDIIRNYGRLNEKINFVQNLRSMEDYTFKHSMNVAILSAMLAHRLKLSAAEQNDVVIAALFHDIGKLSLPFSLLWNENLSDAEEKQIKNAVVAGFTMLAEVFPLNPAVRYICTQYVRLMEAAEKGEFLGYDEKIHLGAHILHVADAFDAMTAMRYGLPPASEVAAIKHLLDNERIYQRPVIDALTSSINILNPGVSVELSNGEKALVLAENQRDILKPMLLNFRDNSIVDLSNKANSAGIEIVDIMKTMDNRHVMDINLLKQQGIKVEEPEYVMPKEE